MADDKRLQILKKITEVLEQITQANGYQHNLTDKVFRGRVSFDETNDPVPLATVFERGDIEEQTNTATQNNLLRKEDWGLVLQGFVDADKDNPIDPAYPLMADCKKALSGIGMTQHPNYLLRTDAGDALVSDINLSPGTVIPPDREKSQGYVQFILFFTVGLIEHTGDPYLIKI